MKNLKCIEGKIKDKDKLVIIIDYDGIITQFRPETNSIMFNSMFKRILQNFAKKEYIKVKIITDKKISDFKKTSELTSDWIKIFGVYGAEEELENQLSVNVDDELMKTLEKFYSELKKKCGKLERITIENKKCSIALHYRLANKNIEDECLKTFKSLVKKFNTENNFKINKRNDYIEVIPNEIEKNKVIAKISNNNPEHQIIYIGDDISLFKETKKHNGIAVGIKPICSKSEKVVDFSVSQNQLEEFFINTNNLYL